MYFKTIVAVALCSRLGILWWVLAVHPRGWLYSNAPDLAFLARSLSSGRGLSAIYGGPTGPTAFVAPGYPAIIGLIFRLFGSYSLASVAAIVAMQSLFAVLTVALILLVADRVSGAPAANLAGAFWALSPTVLWVPAVFWDTGLSALLLLGMVALALRRSPDSGVWAGMGAYCALAMLVNPSLMLALFGVLGWTAYQTRCARGHQLLICFLVFLAVFAPWPIRNALVFHAFIPLRSSLGYELWQGNRPGATGLFDKSFYPLENPGEYAAYAAQGELAYVGNKAAIARAFIRAHPGEFVRLSVKRARLFWCGPPETGFKMLELHAVVTSLLGWVGVAMLGKQNRRVGMLFLVPLLVFPLPYYITHPDFRFRIVLDPLLTILSAYAVTRLSTYRIRRPAC